MFIHLKIACLLCVRHCLDVGNTATNKPDKDPLVDLIVF